LANTRPGNPGTIDPPGIAAEPSATGGTLAAGDYDYGISARTAAGETPVSTTRVTVGAGAAPKLTWGSICNATSYRVYRQLAGATAWSLLDTVAATPSQVTAASNPNVTPPTAAFTDSGAGEWLYTDTGSAGTAGNPPLGNGAALTPYRQNPAFIPALTTAQIKTIATDTSKSYPSPVTKDPVSSADPTNYAPGATFVDGPAQTVPRYPTNLYYNVANRADQLDEYNWIYVADDPATTAQEGNCQPISGVTTCRTTPATWQDYLDSEVGIITNHVMGNDPRPHYVHQTNIADYNPADADSDTSEGGALYAVVNTLLKRYDASIDRAKAPLVQVSQDEAAKTLVRQNAWAADIAAKRVSGYIKDGKVHIVSTTATNVPLTGTREGTTYAGTRSGWVPVAANSNTVFAAEGSGVFASSAPAITGAATDGTTLAATPGVWAGSAPFTYAHQWQRCTSATTCVNIDGATATTYRAGAADIGLRLRVVVTATDATSAVGTAGSALTTAVRAVAPANSALPAISGTTRVGQALNATPGTWSGTKPMTFTYRWQRCNSGGGGCSNIAGATVATYALKAADANRRLRVVVTARNTQASRNATSPTTALVTN
jgi:hypothetical protein